MAFVSASDWRAVNQTLTDFSSWEGNYRAWRRIGSGGLLDDRHKVGGTHDVLVLRLVNCSYCSSPTFSSRWLSFAAHDHENDTAR